MELHNIQVNNCEIVKYEENNPILIIDYEKSCNCPCHTNPDVMHMIACCQNGIIKNSVKIKIIDILKAIK